MRKSGRFLNLLEVKRTCQFVIVRDYNTIEKYLPEVKGNLPEIHKGKLSGKLI